jgi:pimeloyl-ACP methyl ester carboxylesterase
MTGATTVTGLEERTVETGLGRIRAFVGGTGPTVLLLHGLSASATTWVEVIDPLRAAYRVVALDLPGHGGSTAPPRGAGMAWYADAVAASFGALDTSNAVVVGHSFGAQLALRVAERHPDVVRALVLVGPSGVVRLPSRTRVLAVLTTLLRPGALAAPLGSRLAGRAWFRRLAFGPLLAADAAALPERAVRGFFAELREHVDVRTARRAILADPPFIRVSAPRCPAIALWGATDAVVPVEHGFALVRASGVRLRTVADCGHLLIGERPGAVVDAIAAVAGQTGFSTSRNSQGIPN